MNQDRCWSCNHYDSAHQAPGGWAWSSEGCSECECDAFVHELDITE